MRCLLLLLLTLTTARAAEFEAADLFAPKLKTPAAVAKLADAFVKAHPANDRAKAEREFVEAFFTGYKEPMVSFGGTPSAADIEGLAAGKAYRRDHPDKIKEILEGYGYVATEVDGLWCAGFEVSDFKPKTKPKENWWITVLGEDGPARAGAERVHVERSVDGAQVHVVGYLSPEGHYGHFGVGRRELVATSITAPKGR